MRLHSRHRHRRRETYQPIAPLVTIGTVHDWREGRRRPAPPEVSNAELAAWSTGLCALRYLQACFPDVADTIAATPLTPGRLVHVAGGLLGLVNERLPLYINYDIGIDALTTPLEYIAATPDSYRDPAFWLAQLDALHWELESLKPEGFGVGMSAFFDDGEGEVELLTLGIWRLLSWSEWATGIDLADFFNDQLVGGGHSRAHGKVVMGLEPLLPLREGLEDFLEHLTFPVWPYCTPPGTLIAYAVERTDNPLANIQNGRGLLEPMSLAWNELPGLFPLIDEARQIAKDYTAWAEAIDRNPARQLRSLQRQLSAAARPFLHAVNATLIDILVPA